MIYHGTRDYDTGRGELCDLARDVASTVHDLRARAGDFDAIICTGLSGTLVASPVALELRKSLAVLRKHETGRDATHDYGTRIVGMKGLAGKRVLFLDDFVSGGYTRSRCFRAVNESGGIIVAEYQYRDGRYTPIGRPADLIMEGDGYTRERT